MDYPNRLISKQDLLEHWQGHRRLTRRVIELFPDTQLFTFSIGTMRPFSAIIRELISIAGPGLRCMLGKKVEAFTEMGVIWETKGDILQEWDKQTEIINTCFQKLSPQQFYEHFNLFGRYHFPTIQNILYFIDNERRHRAQGYAYLRALDITPPAFWEAK